MAVVAVVAVDGGRRRMLASISPRADWLIDVQLVTFHPVGVE